MFTTLARVGAFTTLSFALTSAVGARAQTDAAVRPQNCRVATPVVLRRALPSYHVTSARQPFAVVRLTLGRDGLVKARRLVWNSGDAAFNRASLRAIEATAFAPASRACVATASTIDYVFAAMRGGRDVQTIVLSNVPR